MTPIKDLAGKIVGKLTVISYAGYSKNTSAVWLCKCSCGREKEITSSSLSSGNSKSCGCSRENINKRHGQSGKNMTSEYAVWRKIKQRCYSVNERGYSDYGGRGIKVCKRWLKSFENFFEDMGKKPTPLHSLDRFPNNNGDYKKSNCRWATQREQANNTRSNVYITIGKVTKTVGEWSFETGIDKGTLAYRRKHVPKKLILSKNRIDSKIPIKHK